jgi:SAM-dependent methyltransferase
VDRRDVPGVDLVADAACLPFQDETAIEIRASSLLEHFEDPYMVLDEVHRVLAADGRFIVRVPTPWSSSGLLDPSHVFLADLKLWREILSAYFEQIRVRPEGVRYRDNRLLVALLYGMIHGLRMFEFAQAWRFTCMHKRRLPRPVYIPWWLEEKYQRR